MNRSKTARRQAAETSRPHAWLLNSHKIGDNNQILALAEALDWPYTTKTIVRREGWLISKLVYKQLLGVTLAGINRTRSSRLAAPWPDLVISASRASEMVARWIAKMSGGRTRTVHIGRPKGPLEAFDLVITTPQYFLPERHNILNIELPLHRVSRDRLQRAQARWKPRLSHLRRPYTTVLVGGDAGKLLLTPETGRRLGRQVNALALRSGGSVLVTSSARTPPAAFDEILRQLTVPVHAYRWNDSEDDNPFYGYLALADQLVVTAESTSMLAEASATGKPLFMFPLDHNASGKAGGGFPGKLVPRFGAQRFQRDIGNIHQLLIKRGRAQWLHQAHRPGHAGEQANIIPCDLQRAAARVRQLFHDCDSVAMTTGHAP